MRRLRILETALETCSTAESSDDNTSRKSEIEYYSDRKLSTGSDVSELAIHPLLVDTRAKDLDREVYQDPYGDRYMIPSGKILVNAADDLEVLAVSRSSMNLLLQKEAVRTDLQPFKQETEPLAKIWCVKMEDD